MSTNLNNCAFCGAPLLNRANFCEKCGQQVRNTPAVSPAAQPYSPSPQVNATQSYPAQPYAAQAAPPQPKRNMALWVLLGAGGCLGFLCIGLIVGSAFFFLRSERVIGGVSTLLTPEPAQIVFPTEIPDLPQEAPAPAPTQADPQPLAPAATKTPPPAAPLAWPGDIGQEINDSYFADDFSTSRYDWAEVQEADQYFGFEDGHYTLHVLREDYTIWAYLPIDFTPNTIGFDAAIQPGYEEGAFGVICHYQDPDNYHFISIDPYNKEYSIGYLLDDEYIELMREMWMPALYLKDSPFEVNNFLVTCDPDMLTLFINNELEAQAETAHQVGGRMAISAETWDGMTPLGFKAWFDNVFAYLQVQ